MRAISSLLAIWHWNYLEDPLHHPSTPRTTGRKGVSMPKRRCFFSNYKCFEAFFSVCELRVVEWKKRESHQIFWRQQMRWLFAYWRCNVSYLNRSNLYRKGFEGPRNHRAIHIVQSISHFHIVSIWKSLPPLQTWCGSFEMMRNLSFKCWFLKTTLDVLKILSDWLNLLDQQYPKHDRGFTSSSEDAWSNSIFWIPKLSMFSSAI